MSTDYKSNICILHITWTCLFSPDPALGEGSWASPCCSWRGRKTEIEIWDLRGLPPIRQGLILSPVGVETQFHFTVRARMIPVKYTRYSFINQKSFWFIDKDYGLCLSSNYSSPGTCIVCTTRKLVTTLETGDCGIEQCGWVGHVGCFILLQRLMEPSCGAVVLWHHVFSLNGTRWKWTRTLTWFSHCLLPLGEPSKCPCSCSCREIYPLHSRRTCPCSCSYREIYPLHSHQNNPF